MPYQEDGHLDLAQHLLRHATQEDLPHPPLAWRRQRQQARVVALEHLQNHLDRRTDRALMAGLEARAAEFRLFAVQVDLRFLLARLVTSLSSLP